MHPDSTDEHPTLSPPITIHPIHHYQQNQNANEVPHQRHKLTSPDEGIPRDIWQLQECPRGGIKENFISHQGQVRSGHHMLWNEYETNHYLLFNLVCSNAFNCQMHYILIQINI